MYFLFDFRIDYYVFDERNPKNVSKTAVKNA